MLAKGITRPYQYAFVFNFPQHNKKVLDNTILQRILYKAKRKRVGLGVIVTPRSAVILSFSLLISTGGTVAPLSGEESELKIAEDGYTSSRVCGGCHEDIYNTWKRSLHALSLGDPVFDVAFMQALKMDSEKARTFCYRCHAPMATENGDYGLRLSVTAEGVSCDFCHSVTDVVLDDPVKTYRSDVGKVKRSILRKAKSPVHEVAYSELHSRAEFCGGCHQYVTDEGAVIMGTYQEWLDGPYAKEGVPCQECHMARSVGHKVRAEVKKTSPGIRLHDLIHNSDQVKNAVSVDVADVERQGSYLVVSVDVANVGSGHMVPTGLPTRELKVVVKLKDKDGNTLENQSRTYTKVIGDKNGKRLLTDAEILMNGAVVLSDNRIAPQEKRREVFHFPGRAGEPCEVSAEAVYGYRPYVLDLRVIEISMDTAGRLYSP